jgi:hypothetical protein
VLEEAGLTVSREVLAEQVHPDTGAHLTYVACGVIAADSA